jgi:hypothetical protein
MEQQALEPQHWSVAEEEISLSVNSLPQDSSYGHKEQAGQEKIDDMVMM